MSLKLDNVQTTEVKNVTDLVVDKIVLDAVNQTMLIVYSKYDADGNKVGEDTLHTNDYLPYGTIKSKVYNILKEELGVTGTVS